ncbi:MAG: hypothetical protein P0S93_06645 [Candidatus Neptunochlamydia sp.]|nr:hypothetical protein [Candidatus Neptunochlamydia sp.]
MTDSTLILHRNYRLAAIEEPDGISVLKARFEVNLTVDIKTLVAKAKVVIHPSDRLKRLKKHKQ